jgi:hypothetical protein
MTTVICRYRAKKKDFREATTKEPKQRWTAYPTLPIHPAYPEVSMGLFPGTLVL